MQATEALANKAESQASKTASNLALSTSKLETSTYFPSSALYKSGCTVQYKCTGMLKKSVTSGVEYQLGTMLNDYRPSVDLIKFINLGKTTMCRLSIKTDGAVTLTPYANLTTDDGVNINECYITK